MTNNGNWIPKSIIDTRKDFDWSGDNDWSGETAYSGGISPTALASNTDNYNPTGLAGSNTIRQDASTDVDLTGLVGGSDGRVILFHNISTSNTITLKHNVTSTAANRFFGPNNADVDLSPNESAELQYDSTSLRWRILSGAATSVGESNTASNVGTGQGLFKQKTGVDLEFRELKDAGNSNIVVSLATDDVTLDLDPDIDLTGSVTTVDLTATGDTTLSGDSVLNGVTLSDKIFLTGEITPPQFTGDQVDFAPSGFSTSGIIRISSDAPRSLTGIAGGTSGRMLLLFNVGSNDINLTHEDGSSIAANQFLLDNGATDEMNPDSGRLIWYDNTSSRWRVLGKVGAGTGAGNVNAAATLTNNKLVVGQGSEDVATTGVTVIASAISSLDTVTFATGVSPSHAEGQLFYDETCGALAFHNFETDITLQIGQENYLFVRNISGSTITNGQVVYLTGSQQSLPTVDLAQSDDVSTVLAIGVATHDIENSSNGFVTTQGIVNGLNTNSFNDGDIVFVDPSTPGAFTATKPLHPNIPVAVGRILTTSPTIGKLYVSISVGLLGVQGTYDSSVSGDIGLDSTIGPISIQDNASPIGGSLFGVFSDGEGTTFLDVQAIGGVTVGLDLTVNGGLFTQKGGDLASAATLNIGSDGNYFDVTGNTTITALTAMGVGFAVRLHFDAALTLTHDATDLVLPGGANITTAAGDEFTFVEYATGDWRCVSYALASGKAIVPAVPDPLRVNQLIPEFFFIDSDSVTISTDQDNYVYGASNIIWNSQSAPNDLTGMVPLEPTTGDSDFVTITLANGSGALHLLDSSGSSLAANRFQFTDGNDLSLLLPGDSVTLMYDTVLNGWRVVSLNLRKVFVSADSNAGQALTASVTHCDYEDNIVDAHGAWTTSDTFTAPRDGNYKFDGVIATTAATSTSLGIWLDTALQGFGPTCPAVASAITGVSMTVAMIRGETASYRYALSETRSTATEANWMTIVEVIL